MAISTQKVRKNSESEMEKNILMKKKDKKMDLSTFVFPFVVSMESLLPIPQLPG